MTSSIAAHGLLLVTFCLMMPLWGFIHKQHCITRGSWRLSTEIQCHIWTNSHICPHEWAVTIFCVIKQLCQDPVVWSAYHFKQKEQKPQRDTMLILPMGLSYAQYWSSKSSPMFIVWDRAVFQWNVCRCKITLLCGLKWTGTAATNVTRTEMTCGTAWGLWDSFISILLVSLRSIYRWRMLLPVNTWEYQHSEIEGILPKGPYLPCISMASRALLAGYHRNVICHVHFCMK